MAPVKSFRRSYWHKGENCLLPKTPGSPFVEINVIKIEALVYVPEYADLILLRLELRITEPSLLRQVLALEIVK